MLDQNDAAPRLNHRIKELDDSRYICEVEAVRRLIDDKNLLRIGFFRSNFQARQFKARKQRDLIFGNLK